jgi:hypothetical protein
MTNKTLIRLKELIQSGMYTYEEFEKAITTQLKQENITKEELETLIGLCVKSPCCEHDNMIRKCIENHETN